MLISAFWSARCVFVATKFSILRQHILPCRHSRIKISLETRIFLNIKEIILGKYLVDLLQKMKL